MLSTLYGSKLPVKVEFEATKKTESMLTYFRPLIQWLEKHKKENNWVTGWNVKSKWTPSDFKKTAFTPKCKNS